MRVQRNKSNLPLLLQYKLFYAASAGGQVSKQKQIQAQLREVSCECDESVPSLLAEINWRRVLLTEAAMAEPQLAGD